MGRNFLLEQSHSEEGGFFKLSNPSWMGWAGGIRLTGFWQVNVAEGHSLLYATERTKGLRIRIDSIRYEYMNTAENYVH